MAGQVDLGIGPGGRLVAVKRASGPTATARLGREADLLERARHPGVVELVELDLCSEPPTLSTWWVSGATLRTAIAQRWDRTILQAALAMATTTLADLHDRTIVHRRLDASHVLVDTLGHAILCGFADATVRGDPAEDVIALGQLVAEIAEIMPSGRRRAKRRAAPTAGRVAKDTNLRRVAERALQPDVTMRIPARPLATLLSGAPPASPGAGPRVVAARAGPPAVPAPHGRRDRTRQIACSLGAAAAITITGVVAGEHAVGDGHQTLVPTRVTDAPGVAPAVTTMPPPLTEPPTTIPTSSTTSPTTIATNCAASATCTPPALVGRASVTSGRTRFRLSTAATDPVLVADWFCRGIATPAVLRLPSGAVDVFESWPTPVITSVTARRVAVVPGALQLESRPARAPGCAVLVVIATDGRHELSP